MFTGLIQGVCRVSSVARSGAGLAVSIDLQNLTQNVELGDSIAVNGTCLTVEKLDRGIAVFQISPETLSRSNMGGLKAGSPVNMETALPATGRFGGHFVLGHVDGTATVKRLEKGGKFWNITFTAPSPLLENMTAKGSVAVDGISLTIAKLERTEFEVAIIFQTLERTTLALIKPGDKVNIETDIIVKTVKQQLQKISGEGQRLTLEKLKQAGF